MLQAALDEIVHPVPITYLTVDTPHPDVLAALDDLTKLTPHLDVSIQPQPHAEVDRVLVGSDPARTLHFVGAPIGTELAAFVSAIVVVGRRDSGLAADTRDQLAGVSTPTHLEVFTTPT